LQNSSIIVFLYSYRYLDKLIITSSLQISNPYYIMTKVNLRIVLMLTSIMVFSHCKKDNEENKPTDNAVFGTVTDIDGNKYKTVTIGTQTWMAENLSATKLTDGKAIKLVTNKADWVNLKNNDTDDAYCYYNNNASGEKNIYGALYTYAAAKKACPSGWHLPSESEWLTLETYIAKDGHSGTEGVALKAAIKNWNSESEIMIVNNYGFSALPGGHRAYHGSFEDISRRTSWWSSTSNNSEMASCTSLFYANDNIFHGEDQKSSGHSIRCIKD